MCVAVQHHLSFPPILLLQTFASPAWSVRTLVPWWGQDDYNTALNAACSLSWDPHAAVPTLWATDFFGVYVAETVAGNASAPLAFTNVRWRCVLGEESTAPPLLLLLLPPICCQVEAGHEEVCMNVIVAPAQGDVLSGAAGALDKGRGEITTAVRIGPQVRRGPTYLSVPWVYRSAPFLSLCLCAQTWAAGATTAAWARGPTQPSTPRTAGRTPASLTSRRRSPRRPGVARPTRRG